MLGIGWQGARGIGGSDRMFRCLTGRGPKYRYRLVLSYTAWSLFKEERFTRRIGEDPPPVTIRQRGNIDDDITKYEHLTAQVLDAPVAVLYGATRTPV